MERFSCPDHGRLAVQLSLGRLDDLEAARAEQVLGECPACADWWRLTFEIAAAATVDEAVADGLAGFHAPRHGARRWWVAAAAAAVVTLGVGTLWWQQRPAPPAGAAARVVLPEAPADAVLTRWTFEEGAIEVVEAVVAPEPAREPDRPAAAAEGAPPVLQRGFESGDLSGWSSHT